MINIAIVKNPFNPLKDVEIYRSDFHTVNSVVGYYNVPVNEIPIIAILNNDQQNPLTRDQWDDELPDEAYLTFIPIVDGGFLSLIITVLLTIVSIAIALSLQVPIPNSPNIAEADPVYSLKGQTNQIKLNEPIESLYGSPRHWPSYAAKPYNMYQNNNAYQYVLLCIGHGSYDVHQVYIEDTPIEDFPEVEFEIVEPNGTFNLFRDNVQTSGEIGSVEMYGPNEDDYGSDIGFAGVVANDAFTTTDKIQIDLTLGRGLYRQNSSGKLRNYTVSAAFDYIQIDNTVEANPIEGAVWANLTTFTKTLATINPQRFTIEANIPAGRYKIRGRRTNNASDSHKVGDTLTWEALRSFLPNVGTYGDVTMLAVKMKATANLNDQSKRKFNVKVTRKLPIYDKATGSWSAPTATRSIVWAFCDIFRSGYGAFLPDTILDLDTLADLDAEFSAFEHPRYFDWVFDSETTVWEAARTCCRVGRAIPMFNGSQLYMVIDKPKSIVSQLFNQENIVADSFEENIKLFVREEYDSIEMEYTDDNTWKAETVLCALPNSFAERPERIILPGVTDRTRAYHEGMYMLAQKKFQRREVTFTTGIEGLLASYGDLIKVQKRIFGTDGSVGGYLKAIEADRRTVTLSQNVEFISGEDYSLLICGPSGIPYGPYTVEASPAPHVENIVVSETDISEDIEFTPNAESPLFIFGRAIEFARDCVITGLAPTENDTVEIKAVLYRPEVYAYDTEEAPDLFNPSVGVVDTGLPVVTGVFVANATANLYRITWKAAQGAVNYIVQVSADDLAVGESGKVWDTIGETASTFFEVALLTDYTYIRVAGINTGQGPWAYHETELYDILVDDEGNKLIDSDETILVG